MFQIFTQIIKLIKQRNEPVIKENTILLWEPCSKSHAEVIPGYAKYFLDLGYHVSVLLEPARYKEGLFSRFENANITFNKLSRKKIKKFFERNKLENVKKVMVTTVGKLCSDTNLEEAYSHFHPETDKSKLLFVEHEAKFGADSGNWNNNIITLRKLHYKNTKSVVINPHYFGKVNITSKNPDITNFISIGALNPKRRNCNFIIKAVKTLHEKGYRNFKVTIVGKGHLKDIPKEIRKYFDIKGRLPFDKMYNEIEKSDFMLTAYDDKNEAHRRYITTGTSGNFQLVYGFLKPCLIIESFAEINAFNPENSVLYEFTRDYSQAMETAINMTSETYYIMQQNLKNSADKIYSESLNNLQNLLNNKIIPQNIHSSENTVITSRNN